MTTLFSTRGRRVAPLSTLVVAALVAACGGTASPNPSTAASVAPSVAPSVASSVEASPASSAGGSSIPSVGLPSGFNADTDLEKQLPDTIGGETLVKLSFKGTEFLTSGGGQNAQQFNDLLSALGKSPSDFSFAVGTASNAGLTVGAFKVAGVDANQALGLFINAATKDTPNSTVSDVSISGKSAKKIEAPGQTTTYTYAHADVIFFVEQDTANQALLDEAFSKLP